MNIVTGRWMAIRGMLMGVSSWTSVVDLERSRP
jgi:hypothetical protein